jgi:hypothetical protein
MWVILRQDARATKFCTGREDGLVELSYSHPKALSHQVVASPAPPHQCNCYPQHAATAAHEFLEDSPVADDLDADYNVY